MTHTYRHLPNRSQCPNRVKNGDNTQKCQLSDWIQRLEIVIRVVFAQQLRQEEGCEAGLHHLVQNGITHSGGKRFKQGNESITGFRTFWLSSRPQHGKQLRIKGLLPLVLCSCDQSWPG